MLVILIFFEAASFFHCASVEDLVLLVFSFSVTMPFLFASPSFTFSFSFFVDYLAFFLFPPTFIVSPPAVTSILSRVLSADPDP